LLQHIAEPVSSGENKMLSAIVGLSVTGIGGIVYLWWRNISGSIREEDLSVDNTVFSNFDRLTISLRIQEG
jgi:hypothetical protein